jgi:hypothetical protein
MIEHPPSVDDAPEHEGGSRSLMRSSGFAVCTPPAMNTLLAVSGIPLEAHASTISRLTRTRMTSLVWDRMLAAALHKACVQA